MHYTASGQKMQGAESREKHPTAPFMKIMNSAAGM
jgi:hypothetical protein